MKTNTADNSAEIQDETLLDWEMMEITASQETKAELRELKRRFAAFYEPGDYSQDPDTGKWMQLQKDGTWKETHDFDDLMNGEETENHAEAEVLSGQLELFAEAQ